MKNRLNKQHKALRGGPVAEQTRFIGSLVA
jgi:hypothetical protein